MQHNYPKDGLPLIKDTSVRIADKDFLYLWHCPWCGSVYCEAVKPSGEYLGLVEVFPNSTEVL